MTLVLRQSHIKVSNFLFLLVYFVKSRNSKTRSAAAPQLHIFKWPLFTFYVFTFYVFTFYVLRFYVFLDPYDSSDMRRSSSGHDEEEDDDMLERPNLEDEDDSLVIDPTSQRSLDQDLGKRHFAYSQILAEKRQILAEKRHILAEKHCYVRDPILRKWHHLLQFPISRKKKSLLMILLQMMMMILTSLKTPFWKIVTDLQLVKVCVNP